jgi:hypothetical protein
MNKKFIFPIITNLLLAIIGLVFSPMYFVLDSGESNTLLGYVLVFGAVLVIFSVLVPLYLVYISQQYLRGNKDGFLSNNKFLLICLYPIILIMLMQILPIVIMGGAYLLYGNNVKF